MGRFFRDSSGSFIKKVLEEGSMFEWVKKLGVAIGVVKEVPTKEVDRILKEINEAEEKLKQAEELTKQWWKWKVKDAKRKGEKAPKMFQGLAGSFDEFNGFVNGAVLDLEDAREHIERIMEVAEEVETLLVAERSAKAEISRTKRLMLLEDEKDILNKVKEVEDWFDYEINNLNVMLNRDNWKYDTEKNIYVPKKRGEDVLKGMDFLMIKKPIIKLFELKDRVEGKRELTVISKKKR